MSTRTRRTVRRLVLVPLYFLLASFSHAATGCGSDSTGPCCKVCKDGKACGDTCISKSDTCHVGKGCACQG